MTFKNIDENSNVVRYTAVLTEKTKTFFKSRWSGLLLGPTYGVLLYVYITYMILRGLPFTPNPNDLNVSSQNFNAMNSTEHGYGGPESNIDCSVEGLLNKYVLKIGNNITIKNNKNNGPINPFNKTHRYQKCKPLMTEQTR